MTLQARLDALKERHASLETAHRRRGPATPARHRTLTRLKIEKLQVKEEMERLRTQN